MPDRFEPLFEPKRFKVLYGGRGGLKSWQVARALLTIGSLTSIKILCFREIQKSIQQSVHALLAKQISVMGLDSQYEVLKTEIRNIKTGSVFVFTGLSDLTAESIKSYEDFDIAWGEEAKNLTKRSLTILTPTIRKVNTDIYSWHDDYKDQQNDAEIWLTFNPELETDEVYKRFVLNKPDDCWLLKTNYLDYIGTEFENAVLNKDMADCEVLDPKGYTNIWLGQCLPAVEGAIYYDEVQAAQDEGRICNVPYNPALLVHVVVDLGWNDAMSIIMCQRNGSEISVIDYIEDDHKKLTDYSIMLKDRPYAWGNMILPHDGYNESVQAESPAKILTDLGWSVPTREELTEMNVENGIKAARMVFPRVYFDKTKANRLIECLKRYKRIVGNKTGEAGRPQHDEFSHGADAFRYLALAIDLMGNNHGNHKPIKYKNRALI